MAYEKYTWVDGELITAEKLNHMEDGIAEGGDCDCGFECTETTEQLFSETVTTVQDGEDVVAQLAYSDPITADKIIVTFDGTQYVCPKIIVDALGTGMAFYGGMSEAGRPDFTNYPFIIVSRPDANVIATPTANTYHINVAAVGIEATNISPCFASAVKKSSDSSGKIKTATLSTDNVSVDGLTTVLLTPLPDDYGATVGVIGIFPLETEDVYANGFDCSGNRDRFVLNYRNKQSSPATIDHVECRFTYIPESGDE